MSLRAIARVYKSGMLPASEGDSLVMGGLSTFVDAWKNLPVAVRSSRRELARRFPLRRGR
jgi:hypothetical protein